MIKNLNYKYICMTKNFVIKFYSGIIQISIKLNLNQNLIEMKIKLN